MNVGFARKGKKWAHQAERRRSDKFAEVVELHEDAQPRQELGAEERHGCLRTDLPARYGPVPRALDEPIDVPVLQDGRPQFSREGTLSRRTAGHHDSEDCGGCIAPTDRSLYSPLRAGALIQARRGPEARHPEGFPSMQSQWTCGQSNHKLSRKNGLANLETLCEENHYRCISIELFAHQ